MKALIICYHCVKDEGDSYLRPTRIGDFENQMRYLSMRYHPIALERMAQFLQNGTPLPPKAIAVTFDDGYRDNYENAYPILKRYNIPATVFLATDFIGTGRIPSWEEGYCADRTTLMLSWKQVREMSDGGISFGSHTLTHPFLTRIQRKQLECEVRLSKDIIEQQTGKSVSTFAYPSGDFDSNVKRVVKETGYLAAVSTRSGQNDRRDDIHALRRNVIQLQSVCHRLFPVSFLAEITGVVGRMRTSYYTMRKVGVQHGQ
jgi:peptidoglycan/xylan/chitin deacetylase (PgdA/CDA1 family)